jgi:2-isopropylmalate synthase
LNVRSSFETYEEHALGSGETAEAVAYIELLQDGKAWFGVGRDRNTTTASFRAILSALNRMDRHGLPFSAPDQ